ncbi:MAG: AAA family ATPase [Caldilineales bacterium]|nr:AAA family ATPase [Caldilineales bacterium]
MICPHCHTDNRPTANYCKNCGNLLTANCPRCRVALPENAHFCDNCGLPLVNQAMGWWSATSLVMTSASEQTRAAQPAADELDDQRLSRYIPAELLAKLEAARRGRAMVGERRNVTILFCDVIGSTATAGRLDPEEWSEIINGAYEWMIRPVYQYEGTIARLTGDGIIAFFGAPIAHEDDPQRAVLAGLQIQAGIKSYHDQVKARWDIDFDCRVGINTGLVVVGEVGSDLRMEYTALGDAINMAARMEQTAQPGSVQISEHTHKLVAPLFEIEELGGVVVKGKEGLVPAYCVLGRKAEQGRLRGIRGLSTGMVGRTRELEAIRARLAEVRKGRGQILCIIGEAGLGKSRLVAEARTLWLQEIGEATAAPLRWSESQGISYETAIPYLQFQQHLRHLCGVAETDSQETVRARLADVVHLLPPDQQTSAQMTLARLLAVGGVEVATGGSEGEAFKRELFACVQALWQAWAEQGPFICVFDDLQWADNASLELLTHLLALTDAYPLLFVCIFRPRRKDAAWEFKVRAEVEYAHRYSEITLSPLSADDSNALVDNLLAVADLPNALRREIITKSDGNPFFVEEMVRAFIDHGLLVRDGDKGWRARADFDLSQISVPDNLQALLIARIDRLEEETRQTLQLASVIGRRFFRRVLAQISEASAELDQQLLALQRSELILEASRLPEVEFMFRHTLTQEAAYNTILRKRRREFHRRVGEAIEQLFSERLEEFYPVLAHHFSQAGDARALAYEIRAGDAAFSLYAIPEAVSYYQQAAEGLRKDANASPDSLRHVFLRLGRCLELQNRYIEALQLYEELETLALGRKDPRLELASLSAQAIAVAIPSDVHSPERAKTLSERALTLARDLGEREAEARALWGHLISYLYSGEGASGISYGEQAAALARELNLRELEAHAMQDLSLAYSGLGNMKAMRTALDRAAVLWQELNDLPMLSETRANSAYHRLLVGAWDEAVSLADEAYNMSVAIGNQWGQVNSQIFINFGYLNWGEIDRNLDSVSIMLPLADQVRHPSAILIRVQQALMREALGDRTAAMQLVEEAIAISDLFPPFRSLGLATLGRFQLQDGNLAEAIRLHDEALSTATIQTLVIIEMSVRFLEIEIALAQGRPPDARAKAEKLVDHLHKSGILYFLPEALGIQSQTLQACGEGALAHAALVEAVEIAESIGMRHPTWLLLDRLSEMESDRIQADDYRRQARAALDFIIAHTNQPDLRATLLARSEAQTLLNS